MNILTIRLALPGQLFSIFYSVAFLTAILVLLYEGHRRKFPMIQWILIIAFSQILFIIGTKLFALSGEEWHDMLENLRLIQSPKKELFGGMLLLGLGLWIGKSWMKFRPSIPDAFALAIPLALSFQKLGCFSAGCCFGKVCSAPWAVQYTVMTLPHYHHFREGLIQQGELWSLPVHPVQLYELLGTLLVVALVLIFRKKWKREGSSFVFSISLYLLVRWLVEFFKDPLAHTSGGAMIGAMNVTQWGILVLLPVLLFLLVLRERKVRTVIVPASNAGLSLPAVLSFLAASVLVIFVLSGWFSALEFWVIMSTFIAAAVMTMVYLFRNNIQFRYKMVYSGLLILPFFLMSQTLPQQMKDSLDIKRSKVFSFGMTGASFDNTHEIVTGEGCDRIGNRSYFNQKYFVAGAGLGLKNENLTWKLETEYGLNLIVGNHAETFLKYDSIGGASGPGSLTLPDHNKALIFDVNPYFKFETRWFGGGGGLHIGKISYAWHMKEESGSLFPASGRKLISLFPMLYLRIGPQDIAFVEYHLADQFPSALPGYAQMIGIGSGFGKKKGLYVRIGSLIGNNILHPVFLDFGFANRIRGFYATGLFPLKENLSLEPFLLIDTSELDSKTDLHFALALHYEWGNKMIRKARQEQ
jgi:prolipoprotein diacylglyceryltransferase